MKKLILALLALFVAIGPAVAQPRERVIHPALFVVRDADSTLYLFGTIHIRHPGDPWGGPEAQTALASAEEIWTEILIDDSTNAQTMAAVGRLGLAPADRPLRTWLSDAENAQLDALCQRLGVNRGALEPLQPWLAAVTLDVMPMVQAGYDPAAGVDRAIDAIGDAAGRRMRAFETPVQQMQFLADLSPEVQRDMLAETISEAQKGTEQIDAMSRAWERGDLNRLERLIVEDMRSNFSDVYQALLVERNRNWIPMIDQEMAGSGVDFVAVGAGHLLGPDGLVALLRARGYTVERVAPSRR